MASTVMMKGQKVVWGTTGLGEPVGGGICVNGSVQKAGQHDPVEDENGSRIGMVIYDETYTISLTAVMKAAGTPPAIGDKITCAGVSGYVTDVKRDWQNKGKMQMSITAEGGKNLA